MTERLQQLITLGREHYHAGEYDRAEQYLGQVVQNHRNFPDIFNMLGIDRTVLGFAIAITLLASVAFSLVPAIQASYSLPRRDWIPEESRLTAIWIPQYFPYRFPLVGERWFPPAAVPPSTFEVPQLMQSIPLGFQLNNASPPSFSMANAGYAARLSGFSHGVDYALCYYHGFDRAPERLHEP